MHSPPWRLGANHRWAMANGERSVRLELARRHAAADPLVAGTIPAPPGPTFPHNLGLVRRAGRRRVRGTAEPTQSG